MAFRIKLAELLLQPIPTGRCVADPQPGAQRGFQAVRAQIDPDLIAFAKDGCIAGFQVDAYELLELDLARRGDMSTKTAVQLAFSLGQRIASPLIAER